MERWEPRVPAGIFDAMDPFLRIESLRETAGPVSRRAAAFRRPSARALVVAGLVMIACGTFAVLRGTSPWAGGVAVSVGALLAGAGFRGRKA